jgi:ATP-binding cassette subfamily B protein
VPEVALPSRLSVARRLAVKAVLVDPWRSLAFVVLASMVAASGSLFAFWFRQIVDDVGHHQHAAAATAAAALAGTMVVWALFDYAGSRAGTVVSEKARRLADEELLIAVAGSPGLEIHETPEHLAQLERLESEGWEFGEATSSLVAVLFNAVWAATTFVLLSTISPWLLLLPLAGLPSLALSGKTNGLFVRGNDAAAEPARRADAWWRLTTTSASNRELRLFGAEEAAMDGFAAAQADRRTVQRRLQVEARLIGLATRSVFAGGYVGAVVFVVERAVHGSASAGDVILTASLAGQVLNLVNRAGEVVQWSLRTLTAAGRFVYLLDVARRSRPDGARLPPDALADGIRLAGVTYRYPGSRRPALADVDLFLPAGTTVAVVGDNGAGKSTLVKLLCGLYTPESGRIEIDGVDLSDINIDAWRRRVSACFQDFARVELSLRESVGVGDLALDDSGLRLDLPADSRIRSAIESAGAHEALERAGDLDGVLGLRYAPGAELSVGQWQLVGLARAATRSDPLLLLLDEPTAALDPDAERDLWERYTSQSKRAARHGGITVIVSHRLSTVRTADLIVVVDDGGVVEVGDHADLVQAAGRYAELFALQARAYQ